MDDESDEPFHPNWMALATVKMRPKIFVKSTGTEEICEKIPPAKIEINESASLAYKEIIDMPSTSKQTPTLPVEEQRKRRKVNKSDFNQETFFRLALADDAHGIQNIFDSSHNPDVNATDNFGWTALMMSACEGSENSFRKLMELGADLSTADKKGNTAMSLAYQKGFNSIFEVIDEFRNKNQTIEISDDEDEPEQGSLFCKECGIEVSKAGSTAHQSSTVHLFSCKFKGNTDIRTFGIPRNNKGFQMMSRSGWDGRSGLGSSQKGKLYPIKTVIRKRNTGLGIDQDTAKITHFKPNDPSSIKYNPPPKALTRKEIHENDQRDKRHVQRLRRALS